MSFVGCTPARRSRYLLGYCLHEYGLQLHAACFMGDHHHLDVADRARRRVPLPPLTRAPAASGTAGTKQKRARPLGCARSFVRGSVAD